VGDASGGRRFYPACELAARCVKTPMAELSLELRAETSAGRNSLARVDFILSLEAKFGMAISPADMLSIIALGDAIKFVRTVHFTRKAAQSR